MPASCLVLLCPGYFPLLWELMVCTSATSLCKGVLEDTGSQDEKATAQKAVTLLEPDILTLELLTEWRAPE